MAELTSSTREAARRLGVSDTTMHKAERKACLWRCEVDKCKARADSSKWQPPCQPKRKSKFGRSQKCISDTNRNQFILHTMETSC
jgi:hypothetical protein